MSEDLSEAIVLQDSKGDYFVIPRETLEGSRVPAGSRAAVESDLGEVSGYAFENFSLAGQIAIPTPRVQQEYSFRNAAWPCDAPQSGFYKI